MRKAPSGTDAANTRKPRPAPGRGQWRPVLQRRTDGAEQALGARRRRLWQTGKPGQSGAGAGLEERASGRARNHRRATARHRCGHPKTRSAREPHRRTRCGRRQPLRQNGAGCRSVFCGGFLSRATAAEVAAGNDAAIAAGLALIFGGDGGESNSPSRRAYKPNVLQACPAVCSWTNQLPSARAEKAQPVSLRPPLPASDWPHPGLMAPDIPSSGNSWEQT